MKTVALVGVQWGDEGKGKIADLLAAQADVVARFQGGNNAAHTVVRDGQKFVLRLVPAGALHPGTVCVIGNGTVVDPFALLGELEALDRRGYPLDRGLLRLSAEAHMVLPYHQEIDRAREARLGRRAIGTTGFGIGPAYEDKMARCGVRFGELVNFAALRRKLERNIEEKNRYLKAVLKAPKTAGDQLIARLRAARPKLLPYLCETGAFMEEARAQGKRILLEGAHGTMLDLDHGTYPFVTSSNCVAGAAFAGGGLAPGSLEAVLGVSKAYATRVGAGPFPTEIKGGLARLLRREGEEFGSATGRPRRVGWFDAPLARYAARLNGLWALALTKLDVLTGIDPLRICVAYELKGARLSGLPSPGIALEKVRPLYEELPGWSEKIGEARRLEVLPANARRYVERIAELSGVSLAFVSVGPQPEQTIVLQSPFDS